MNVNQMMIIMKYIVLINEIYNVKKELEKEINNFISTEIEWIPLIVLKFQKKKMMI